MIDLSFTFLQGITADLFPAAKKKEVAPVAALAVLAVLLMVATRARLGCAAAESPGKGRPAYATT